MQSNRTRVAAAIVFSLAASIALPAAQSALAQLGVAEPQANDDLFSALKDGFVHIGEGAALAFKAAPAAARKTIIEGIVGWAKRHTASAEFKRSYAAHRDASKPEPPPSTGAVEEELKRQRDEQQKQIEEMKKMVAAMPADQRKAIEDGIKEMMAAQNDPEMRKMLAAGAEIARQDAKEQYQRALAKWNKDFPENPDVLIARRLRTFLETSASIDFSAKLVARDGLMKFADEKYEAKSSQWKMCYRAGADAVAAARAVASAWLQEISPR